MNERLQGTGPRQAADPDASDPEALRSALNDARGALEASELARRLAVDRETVLRGELQHRVRNMLSVIRSIFSRTIAAGGSIEEVGDHFRGRLDTIARFHSAQAVHPCRDFDFEQMVRDELHAFQFGDDPKIEISGHDVRLGGDAAQLVGLALHELATNSIKFGALSREEASLAVVWAETPEGLRLEWREAGVPVVGAAPLATGFGREFIEQGLPYQLGARTSFELRPGGVTCVIVLPAESRASEGGVGRND